MGALVLTRRQQPVIFTGAGSKSVIQLNKGLVYRELVLRLTGQITLAGASNTAALTLNGDEWALLSKVEVIINGSDVLLSMSGSDLWWLNQVLYEQNPQITPGIGDGATVNPAFDSTLIIPFWSVHTAKMFDTAFFSGEVTDFRLELTWAAGSFAAINAAATAFTVNPAVEVASHESEMSVLPPLLQRRIKFIAQPTGVSSAFRVPLDVGPSYRSFLINATTAGVDTAGLFSNVKLVSGSTVFFDMSEAMLNRLGTLRWGIPNGQLKTTAGVAYQSTPRVSTQSSRLGWYLIDLVTDGYLTECINSSNLSELYLEFAVSAACNLNVIATQLINLNRQPRAAA